MVDFSERSHRLFRRAVWATALVPSIVPFFVLDPAYPPADIARWTIGYAVFLAAMWAARAGARPWPLLVAVQTLAALGATWLFPSSVEGAMLVAVAAQVAGRTSMGVSFAVAAGQTAVFAGLLARTRPIDVALDVPLAWFAFEAFAILLTHVARSEAEGRAALLERNVQLLATRQLLAEHARSAERLRIARNLHDGLGHHLTALSLNLEAAVHLSDGPAREHIARAQAVTRALLDETRTSVAEAREAAVDPLVAIRAMLAPIDSPRVHFDAPPSLRLPDPAQAEALLRLVQEIVTNALRHASARNLWISVSADGPTVEVRGRDDGQGAAAWHDGHGLRGMRERLAELGGSLDVASRPGAGFTVAARLPVGEGRAVIRVCLVEDQALVRQGIASLLALTPDIRVVAEASDGDEALDVVEATPPDVLLLDIRLPKRVGTEVVRELAARGRLPATLLLTTFDDDEALITGILAGARGFLLKDVTLDRLADAIRTLAAGGSMIHPAATARIASGLAARRGGESDDDWPLDALSTRELEVLRLMAAGFSNREIGNMLAMVEGTVKNHVSSILSKLGVRDRTRAVLKSFELGWL